MNFVLSLMVLSSVVAMNSAIVSSPALAAFPENVKKEKRGIYGPGVHGHHPHYEDLAFPPNHHVHGVPPLGPAPLAPVNLGAHYHTTITKKIGVPIPYPVKVPVPIYNTIYKTIPVDRPVPVPHYVQVSHPYANPHSPLVGPIPSPHHSHHPWPAHRW